jgi:hypothetical protein
VSREGTLSAVRKRNDGYRQVTFIGSAGGQK